MSTAAIDYGVAHFYGLYGTSTYMTVQSDSISESFKLDVEVADVNGRVITDHLDDRFMECTLDGVLLNSADTPENGTRFTYASISWILKSIDDKGTNKDFRKVSVKGISYQEIA